MGLFSKEKENEVHLDDEETEMLIEITKNRANNIKEKRDIDIRLLEVTFNDGRKKIEDKYKNLINKEIDELKDQFIIMKEEFNNACKSKLEKVFTLSSKLNKGKATTKTTKMEEPLKNEADIESDKGWDRTIFVPSKDEKEYFPR